MLPQPNQAITCNYCAKPIEPREDPTSVEARYERKWGFHWDTCRGAIYNVLDRMTPKTGG